MPTLLSSSDSEEDNESPQKTFKINESYAKRLEHNKAREELHRLQSKYGNEPKEEDEDEVASTSESEDEVGDLVTPRLDAEIWRTIAMIRERRPEVYNEEWQGFAEDSEPQKREKKEKVITSSLGTNPPSQCI
jgi:protein KRI1